MLLTTLSTAINAYLQLDPLTQSRFETLQDKTVYLELTDLKLSFYLQFKANKCELLPRYDGMTAARIKTTLFTLTNMMGSDFVPVNNNMSIEGDLELGQAIKDLFSKMDVDWEGQLAKVTSDGVAHQVGRVARQLFSWGGDTVSSLRQSVSEYVQEEAKLLPPRLEINSFLDDIDQLRHDVERLQLRVSQLDQ